MRKFRRIKGISDVQRLTRLGKIKLGVKIEKGRTQKCDHPEGETCFFCSYPAELPFFYLPEKLINPCGGNIPGIEAAEGDPGAAGQIAVDRAKEMGVTSEKVLAFIRKNWPAMAEELYIYFPVEEEEEIFPQSLTWWGRRGAKCRGNMEEAERYMDDGTVEGIPCPCEQYRSEGPVTITMSTGKDKGQKKDLPKNPKGNCSISAYLQVFIAPVPGREVRTEWGVYQIDTGSYHSLVDINSSFEQVRRLFGGRISGIPLLLKRMPTVTYGSDSRETHYTMKIIASLPEHMINALRNDTRSFITHASTRKLALPEPDETPPIQPEVIDYPEEDLGGVPKAGKDGGVSETPEVKVPEKDASENEAVDESTEKPQEAPETAGVPESELEVKQPQEPDVKQPEEPTQAPEPAEQDMFAGGNSRTLQDYNALLNNLSKAKVIKRVDDLAREGMKLQDDLTNEQMFEFNYSVQYARARILQDEAIKDGHEVGMLALNDFQNQINGIIDVQKLADFWKGNLVNVPLNEFREFYEAVTRRRNDIRDGLEGM